MNLGGILALMIFLGLAFVGFVILVIIGALLIIGLIFIGMLAVIGGLVFLVGRHLKIW